MGGGGEKCQRTGSETSRSGCLFVGVRGSDPISDTSTAVPHPELLHVGTGLCKRCRRLWLGRGTGRA